MIRNVAMLFDQQCAPIALACFQEEFGGILIACVDGLDFTAEACRHFINQLRLGEIADAIDIHLRQHIAEQDGLMWVDRPGVEPLVVDILHHIALSQPYQSLSYG
ncbi:hypothetical protein XH87_09290 [Bradyrhizobium sp. CCBAU 53415]|nr:hypothetical protein [Bradyrhizobium sp. CCBAU 53415]